MNQLQHHLFSISGVALLLTVLALLFFNQWKTTSVEVENQHSPLAITEEVE